MTYQLMAAIDVGSYELEMKIFEISPQKGIVMIDDVRHVIELGRDTYVTGRVDFKHIDELCETLYGFTQVMKAYKVTEYVAYATSSIREAENRNIIIDRIRVRTGLEVKIIGNAELRFLTYKTLSVRKEYLALMEEQTALVEVGAGSVQISLFDKGTLSTTQNIKLGSLRIRELLYRLSDDKGHFYRLVEELINNDLYTFKKMFLKEKNIKNIIAAGDYIRYFATKNDKYIETMTREQFAQRFESLMGKNTGQLSQKMGITEEQAALLLPSAMIYKRLIEETQTEQIWFPKTDLCDAIAAEYAIEKKIIKIDHNFDGDILNAAKLIAKRYKANQNHIAILEKNVTVIFDAMKKIHGLGDTQRKLLEVAAILHDCGKYISMSTPGEASYNIIMATEIIGLSHQEQKMVANVVKYNTEDFFEENNQPEAEDREDYLTMVKLVAILRVANAMDRSHKQKFKDSKAVLKEDNTLTITTYTSDDITLEKGLFQSKAAFFEEVYGIRPVLRQKKVIRGVRL